MFKIGDRVRVKWDYSFARRGMKGTIKAVRTSCWGIEFDEKFMFGHDCDGKTKDGYGYWVPPEFLEPIKSEKKVKVKTMFKIGDRVRVIKDYWSAKKGEEGIIRALPGKNGACAPWLACYSVEFPAWQEMGFRGHDCTGKVPSGHGFWVPPECLELIKPKDEKIVITHDGNTTLARLYEGKTLVKSAEAKCDPRDEFDFIEGAKIAFERLTKEEPPRFDKAMLSNGRFGYMEGAGWFVVVGDHVVYEKGGWDRVSNFNNEGIGEYFSIKYIVDADAFNYAKEKNVKVIWKAPDFDLKKVSE